MKNKEEFVSIIMPVHNSQKFLEETIESVLNQSYKKFELILIENGSIDDSLKICKKFENIDDRIKTIEILECGVSNARNKGIEEAKYNKILFIDSDDIYDKYFIEKIVNVNEKECKVCYFEQFKNKNDIKKRKVKAVNDNKQKDELIGFLHNKNLFNVVWNKVYFKDILNKFNIRFDINISIAEDLKFNIEYFKHINSIKIINECLYFYRINEQGLNLRLHENRIKIRKDIYGLEKKWFEENKYNLKYIYFEYIKICLSELKQMNNVVSNINEKSKSLKKILSNEERKKELDEIYKYSNIKVKLLVLGLSNFYMLKLFMKIIKLIRKK